VGPVALGPGEGRSFLCTTAGSQFLLRKSENGDYFMLYVSLGWSRSKIDHSGRLWDVGSSCRYESTTFVTPLDHGTFIMDFDSIKFGDGDNILGAWLPNTCFQRGCWTRADVRFVNSGRNTPGVSAG
jgi:hypothetical protein